MSGEETQAKLKALDEALSGLIEEYKAASKAGKEALEHRIKTAIFERLRTMGVPEAEIARINSES